ncbi:MAG: hypothetical protein IT343_10815 [Candidatus Melainabacteria bacterium]|jgi:hypothetical protein|nr:hypothetical protein [Candidatus Melainabacteria bacterium]
MTQKRKWRIVLLTAGFFAGIIMLCAGWTLSTYRSMQIESYNSGIVAMRAGDHRTAVVSFERSVQHFNRARQLDWLGRFLLPAPDIELAARASFHRGMLLVQSRQAKAAVAAFQESLRFNPGSGRAASVSEARRLQELALVVKHNLELLLSQHSQLAHSQGAARNSGDGDGEPRRVPGENPGSMPGPGSRDDL